MGGAPYDAAPVLQLFQVGSSAFGSRAAYRGYLRDRDGDLDVVRRTLSRREEQLAQLPSIEQAISLDADDLRELRAPRFDRQRSYTGDVLLLRSLARVHDDLGLGSVDEYLHAVESSVRDGDETDAVVAAEHAVAARLLGSGGRASSGPRASSRGRRLLAAARPPAWLLSRDIVHAVALLNLLRVTREVLRPRRGACEHVEARVLEVLTDAVGHIACRRLGMTARDLDWTRRLLPAVALALGNRSPEMAALGASVYPSAISMRHRLENGLPAEVRSRAFLG
jgi:hypothetical protein